MGMKEDTKSWKKMNKWTILALLIGFLLLVLITYAALMPACCGPVR